MTYNSRIFLTIIKGTATPYRAAVPLFVVKLHQFSDER
jgi:hypothetical protein